MQKVKCGLDQEDNIALAYIETTRCKDMGSWMFEQNKDSFPHCWFPLDRDMSEK